MFTAPLLLRKLLPPGKRRLIPAGLLARFGGKMTKRGKKKGGRYRGKKGRRGKRGRRGKKVKRGKRYGKLTKRQMALKMARLRALKKAKARR